jgi:S-adenosylmethionine-diacylgycerolhomoserine-N-methlytransferase
VLVTRPERYTVSARAYDLISGERPVYRRGRVAGIAGLGLTPGCSVLDLGCGTGLNHPLLVSAVGPSGSVVGLDRSPPMLAQARRRASREGWSQVRTVQADMADGPVPTADGSTGFDAVVATYALSLVPEWERAWANALQAVRPGGRIAVVDLALPTGRGRLLTSLARAACALGGSDPQAHPWTAVERDCTDVTASSWWGGHVQVRVGTRPA